MTKTWPVVDDNQKAAIISKQKTQQWMEQKMDAGYTDL